MAINFKGFMSRIKKGVKANPGTYTITNPYAKGYARPAVKKPIKMKALGAIGMAAELAMIGSDKISKAKKGFDKDIAGQTKSASDLEDMKVKLIKKQRTIKE